MQINLWKQQHLIYKPGVSQDIIFSQYFLFSTSLLLEAGLKIDHIPFIWNLHGGYGFSVYKYQMLPCWTSMNPIHAAHTVMRSSHSLGQQSGWVSAKASKELMCGSLIVCNFFPSKPIFLVLAIASGFPRTLFSITFLFCYTDGFNIFLRMTGILHERPSRKALIKWSSELSRLK